MPLLVSGKKAQYEERDRSAEQEEANIKGDNASVFPAIYDC